MAVVDLYLHLYTARMRLGRCENLFVYPKGDGFNTPAFVSPYPQLSILLQKTVEGQRRKRAPHLSNSREVVMVLQCRVRHTHRHGQAVPFPLPPPPIPCPLYDKLQSGENTSSDNHFFSRLQDGLVEQKVWITRYVLEWSFPNTTERVMTR